MSTSNPAPSWGTGAARRRMITVQLRRLSICPCGFGVLRDEIRIGAEYRIDIASLRSGFRYICGGCSRRLENVRVVDATQRIFPERPLAPLPVGLFEPVAVHHGRIGVS